MNDAVVCESNGTLLLARVAQLRAEKVKLNVPGFKARQVRAQKRAHAHPHTRTPAHPHTLTPSHPHTRTRSGLTYTCKNVHTRLWRRRPHSLTHTHNYKHTHTHTHTGSVAGSEQQPPATATAAFRCRRPAPPVRPGIPFLSRSLLSPTPPHPTSPPLPSLCT